MRVLLTGANGYLAQYLIRACPPNVKLFGTLRSDSSSKHSALANTIRLDLEAGVGRQLKNKRFDIIIHTAAISSLATCENEPQRADRVNHKATAELAAYAAEQGARLIHLSTDIVFDGNHAPYDEESPTKPVNSYGRSKKMAEEGILARRSNSLILRLPLLLGRGLGQKKNFIDWMEQRLKNAEDVPLFWDEWRTPLATVYVAPAIWTLTLSNLTGIVHLPGAERCSRLELGLAICQRLNGNLNLLKPVELKSFPGPRRPTDTSLASARTDLPAGINLPSITAVLEELL